MRSIYLFAVLSLVSHSLGSPEECMSEASVYSVYKCLSSYVIPSKAIATDDAFAATVPDSAENDALASIIPEILSNSKCPAELGPLATTLKCKEFEEEAVILFEKTTNGKSFKRGWGVFIVNTAPRAAIHLSSSNPTSTGSLVASLSGSIKPISVLVAGIKQDASRNRKLNKCDPSSYPTDGSANTDTYFHQVGANVVAWQKKQGCSPGKCGFIQFNRMKSGVCSDVDLFLSTGTDNQANWSMIDELKSSQSSWKVTTDPGKCKTNTKVNLLGRLMNGGGDVCSESSLTDSGLFFDVQTSGSSSKTRLGGSWVDVMKATFHTPGPEGCFQTNDVYKVFVCFREFILPYGHMTNLERYKQTLPTTQELKDWQNTIKSLLSTGKCPATLPKSLIDQVGCRDLPDAAVLYENTISKCRSSVDGKCTSSSKSSYLKKGWGFFAAAAGDSYRSVHLSAAHPISDGEVGLQVVKMFGPLKAKSVMVSGTRRDSFLSKVDNHCQGSLGKGYYPPDGAHNTETMFHQSLLAIGEWQLSQPGKCPKEKCAFLQFHGMAGNSCPEDVFISAGTNSKPDALKWLKDDSLPIRRVQTAVQKYHKDWDVGTSHTSKCHLFGTTNTFGRVLNGVPNSDACKKNPPSMDSFTGLFVHAEQKDSAKNGLDWVEAIASVFPLNK